MNLSNKFKIHSLTWLMLFVGFLTGYFRYIVSIFAIVMIHECGHIFMMRIFKRKVISIEILPFGGLTKIDAMISENICEDLLICVGGIFFQTILGFVFLYLYDGGFLEYNLFKFLNSYNIFIILFNLVPICPLDGYKIVKLFGEMFLPFKKVQKLAISLSIFVILGISFYRLDMVKDNIFVFIFLLFMCIEELKNEPFILNRFYFERMTYVFDYPRKNVKNIASIYKNRTNYVDGIHEQDVIKNYFTRITH